MKEYNSVTFTTTAEGTEIAIDGLKLKGVVTSEITANGAEPLARLRLEMVRLSLNHYKIYHLQHCFLVF